MEVRHSFALLSSGYHASQNFQQVVPNNNTNYMHPTTMSPTETYFSLPPAQMTTNFIQNNPGSFMSNISQNPMQPYSESSAITPVNLYGPYNSTMDSTGMTTFPATLNIQGISGSEQTTSQLWHQPWHNADSSNGPSPPWFLQRLRRWWT